MKHYLTLDEVINEELKTHPELQDAYKDELLINAISRMMFDMRRHAHLTQKELAKRAATTQAVVARLESGRDSRIPSLKLLLRLANAAHAKLHISIEYGK
jgi:DNA-binding XRE family transcriptional regulator